MTKRLWLLAVTLLIAVTTFYGWRRVRYKDTIAWLERQDGATVRRAASAPAWFREVFGERVGRRVFGTRVVDVILMDADRASMAQAFKVKGLERLFVFGGDEILDADVASVKKLTDLKTLTLNCRQVGDAALVGFGQLTQLESLDLSGTLVTGYALAHLRDLQNLKILRLPNWTAPFLSFGA